MDPQVRSESRTACGPGGLRVTPEVLVPLNSIPAAKCVLCSACSPTPTSFRGPPLEYQDPSHFRDRFCFELPNVGVSAAPIGLDQVITASENSSNQLQFDFGSGIRKLPVHRPG